MNRGWKRGVNPVASPRASENFNSPSSVWNYRTTAIAITCNSWDWVFVTAAAGITLPPNPAIGDQVTVSNAGSTSTVLDANVGQTIAGASTYSIGGNNSVAVVQYDQNGRWDVISAGSVAGGDLTGNYPLPTVARINGASVAAPGNSGQILVASGASSLSWTQGLSTVYADMGTTDSGTLTNTPTTIFSPTLAVGTWLVIAQLYFTGDTTAAIAYWGAITGGTASYTTPSTSNPGTSMLTSTTVALDNAIALEFSAVVTVTVQGTVLIKAAVATGGSGSPKVKAQSSAVSGTTIQLSCVNCIRIA